MREVNRRGLRIKSLIIPRGAIRRTDGRKLDADTILYYILRISAVVKIYNTPKGIIIHHIRI